MLKTTLTELYKLAHAADQAAPGGWHEDGNVHNDSGSNYRDSEVRNQRGVVLDTLNADYLLTPDERYAIGAYVAAVDPPTVMALLDHARIQDCAVASKDDEIKRLEADIESRKRASARYSELAIRLVSRALKERDENYARARAAEERLHGK